MIDKKERLKSILHHKRSAEHYAQLLEVPVKQIIDWKEEFKHNLPDLTIEGSPEYSELSTKVDNDKGTYAIDVCYSYPPNENDIIRDHNIDMSKYKLSAFYSKARSSGWFVTALFKQVTEEQVKATSFQEFLENYKPAFKPVNRETYSKGFKDSALIINAQDGHWNKLCQYGTGNDIEARFEEYEREVYNTLTKANRLTNVKKVVYIIGSDHFNSEVTGATVKGTVQSNILNYHESFQLVCEHEVRVIADLLKQTDEVDVMYLIGNHDSTVSFHMVSWLQAYFRNESRVNVDASFEFTKYFSLFDTAVMVNHGDAARPEKLVQNFPLEYKKGFYEANHHCLISGDKHSEITRDIGGVKWYQIPAISKAKGDWDKQMGYTVNKAQITTMMVEPGQGISTIFKSTLN